jgi:hypothetical protein
MNMDSHLKAQGLSANTRTKYVTVVESIGKRDPVKWLHDRLTFQRKVCNYRRADGPAAH